MISVWSSPGRINNFSFTSNCGNMVRIMILRRLSEYSKLHIECHEKIYKAYIILLGLISNQALPEISITPTNKNFQKISVFRK